LQKLVIFAVLGPIRATVFTIRVKLVMV